ncbi:MULTISPECIES: DMT family transporter [Musicola]|uniref:DMT family transporter n=1 Tax=Musicola paradisiaca (strain Ech703) TaxID=579405 RepID=C6C724_MUSP7|nr:MULTISPECIES: DMT family transporter [Musicola]ACS85918.1 protein of unknown function DUF606 [Musicola paradisiaca Ech703]
MAIMMILAVLNGGCIALSRLLNGRLGMARSAFFASFWNHLLGFLFLTLTLCLSGDLRSAVPSGAPAFAWLGGVIGALFVAVNSYVLPRLGAMKATLLVIGGQMLTGVLADAFSHATTAPWVQIGGVVLILAGLFLSKTPATTSGEHRREQRQVWWWKR